MSARSLLGGILDRAPVSYVGRRPGAPGNSVMLRGDGKTGELQTMGSVGSVFGIVNKTSTTTATPEWKLFRKAASGLKEDRQQVQVHKALSVWTRPNNFLTRQELVESVQQHVDLTGEGWLVYEYGQVPWPIAIWYVRPDRIAPVPHPDNFLSGYIYSSPSGEKVPLQLNEVSQIRMPDPENPYRGMGPIQSVLRDIDSVRYSSEWNANFFLNSAEPGGIVKIPSGMSDPQFDQLVERWNANHKGVSRAHRVAFLENAEYIPRAFSQRDMQFVEMSKLSDEKILQAFGFPKFALGEVADVNRATAEASKAWFAETLTVPRLDRWKSLLNNDFLPLFYPNMPLSAIDVEFDYDNPVPPSKADDNDDRTNRTEAWARLVLAGADPEDAAAYCGLPPMRMRTQEGVAA